MASTQFLPSQLDSLIQAAITGSISAQHLLGDHFGSGFYDDNQDLVPIYFNSTELEGA